MSAWFCLTCPAAGRGDASAGRHTEQAHHPTSPVAYPLCSCGHRSRAHQHDGHENRGACRVATCRCETFAKRQAA